MRIVWEQNRIETARFIVNDGVCTYGAYRTSGKPVDGRSTLHSVLFAFRRGYDGDPNGSVVTDRVTGQTMAFERGGVL